VDWEKEKKEERPARRAAPRHALFAAQLDASNNASRTALKGKRPHSASAAQVQVRVLANCTLSKLHSSLSLSSLANGPPSWPALHPREIHAALWLVIVKVEPDLGFDSTLAASGKCFPFLGCHAFPLALLVARLASFQLATFLSLSNQRSKSINFP